MNNSSKEVLKINKLNAINQNTTTYVLRGLNLKMNRGDRLALVGSSGCGKSTVAKAIMQLLPYGSACYGEIFLNGINILDLVLLTKLGNSKGEVRRMIKNNGLKINNETISDENKIFYEDSFNQNNGMKVSHGKKQHVIVKII